MQRAFLVILLLLVVGSAAQAGTIVVNFGTPQTLTTTARQDAFLTSMLARENTRRAAQNPPLIAWTMEQYLNDLIVKMLKGYQTEAAGLDHQDACTTFKALTAAQQATIVTSMGGKSPCP